jgi:hypothetical protein
MPDNSLRPLKSASKANGDRHPVAAQSPREIEDLQINFLMRRLRIAPYLATVVAPFVFRSGTMTERLESAIETAIREGAVRALRRRAKVQADRATAGETQAGEKYPGVIIRSGESAIADSLSVVLSTIADELERWEFR